MNSSSSTMEKSKVKELIKDTQLFIGGRCVDALSGKKFLTYDPSTEEAITEVAEGDEQDVEVAVKAARRAFDKGPWPRLSGYERGAVLNKLADLMERHLEELICLESLNNGTPVDNNRGIMQSALLNLRYYAGWADKINGKTLRMPGSMHGYTLLEPIGVVGAIIPWNLPVLMFINKVAPALVCGNTVIVKPAEQTPLTALFCAKLATEAGVPPGVLNVIPGFGPTAGAAIASHMDIDKAAFTGSTEVGRLVMKAAAMSNLKPVTLELGGKSPVIICEDVDLDYAVEVSYQALYRNQGQNCIAGSRVIVQESIYDEFLKKAVERAKKRIVGEPLKPGVEHGPQINREQLDKIMGYIQSGKDEGAKLLVGGNRIGERGFYVAPTIFADVKGTMKIAQDEIFGPVMAVMKFRSIDEAVEEANNTRYGLGSAVLTNNINVANKLTRSIRAGIVFLNTYYRLGPSCPFGGYKMSGIGREMGSEGLMNYLQIKTVVSPLTDSPWN